MSGGAQNVFLIGYRCTGKSTVGKSVAEKLGWRFVDADAALIEEQGESIAHLVSRFGWERFRQIEKAVLSRLCRCDHQVVATGGGVVLDGDNVRRMRQAGRIVCLRATPETIYRRMVGDPGTVLSRPSLSGKTPWDEIVETLSLRRSFYDAAMEGVVDTDGKSVAAVTAAVLAFLAESGGGSRLDDR